MEPFDSFAIKDKTTVGPLAGFLIIGGFLVRLAAALRETTRRVELAKAVQETHFAELQHWVAKNLQS